MDDDVNALDMADHALERLNINTENLSSEERESLGKDLLRYAVGLLLREQV